MSDHLVFVYGTLKRGHGNHRLLTNSELLGEGTIANFKMFSLGAFPGIVAGNGIVHGELYSVTDCVLQSLDWLEGYDSSNPTRGMYNREITQVRVENTRSEAIVYTYNGCEALMAVIPEGVW